jgi:aryl carrier-like protein
MAEAENQLDNQQNALDDRGLDVAGGLALLKRLRDSGFESDNEKFAVALGRPAEEVAAWMEGAEPPDDDIIMKARGIARERGVEIE